MIEPGWYPAEGDPPGTVRYWDGTAWQGGPQVVDKPFQQQPFQQQPFQQPTFVNDNHLSSFGYWKHAYIHNYANFSGRARRAEYGWAALINVGIIFVWGVSVFLIVEATGDASNAVVNGLFIVSGLLILLAIIPSLALSVRRWHDRGLTGWMVLAHGLVQFAPFIGQFISLAGTLFLLFADSNPEPNQWGRSPKYG